MESIFGNFTGEVQHFAQDRYPMDPERPATKSRANSHARLHAPGAGRPYHSGFAASGDIMDVWLSLVLPVRLKPT